MAQRRHEETSETPGEIPNQPSRTTPGATGENRFDPIAVASAALSSPDPLAATGQTPSGDDGDQEHASDDDSGTPLRERLGGLLDRARAVITPGSESEDSDGSGRADSASEGSPAPASAPKGEHEPESQPQPPGASDHETGEQDPGWVFHRKVGDDGFEGWLYHYADGTMVDEAGVVYEYPSHEANSLAHDPSVKDAPDVPEAPGPTDRNGESPAPATTADKDSTREADDEAGAREESESDSELAREESESDSEQEAKSDSEAEAKSDTEAEAESDTEREAESDSKPEAESDTESEQAAEDSAGGESDRAEQTEDDAPEKPQDDKAEEDESDEDAPIPHAETGSPLAGVTETVTGTWLTEKAGGKQALPPDGEEAPEDGAASADGQSETVYIPRFIEYSPSNLLRYVSGGLFALASIAAVMTIFYAMQAASTPYMILGGAFILVALVAAWVLLSWEPTVVSIRDGILEVAKGPTGEEVDLRDPRTKVDIGSNIGSPLWRMTVERAGADDIRIHAGQVKARQFAAIVEHHVQHPREQPKGDSED